MEEQLSGRCRYLGIQIVSDRAFRCKFDDAKARFFRAFNSLYSKVGGCASEDVVLNLVRSKCLPILLHMVHKCVHSFHVKNTHWSFQSLGYL